MTEDILEENARLYERIQELESTVSLQASALKKVKEERTRAQTIMQRQFSLIQRTNEKIEAAIYYQKTSKDVANLMIRNAIRHLKGIKAHIQESVSEIYERG